MKKLLTFIMACVISPYSPNLEKHLRNGIRTSIPCSSTSVFIPNWEAWEGNPVTRGYSEQIQSFAESSVTGMEIPPCASIPPCLMQTLSCHWPKKPVCAPSSLPPSITTVSVCSVQPPPTIIHTMPPPASATS